MCAVVQCESIKTISLLCELETYHVFQANHAGSSGSMEAIGFVKMFSRSISESNLMYTKYVGNGVTKSFKYNYLNLMERFQLPS